MERDVSKRTWRKSELSPQRLSRSFSFRLTTLNEALRFIATFSDWACYSLRLPRWHFFNAEPFVYSWVSLPPGRKCKEGRRFTSG